MASGTRSRASEFVCKRPADDFCYVCGRYLAGKSAPRKYHLGSNPYVCEIYEAYFKTPVQDQDEPWTPHYICEPCRRNLDGWRKGEHGRKMKFGVPRIWRRPVNHVDGCFFCADLSSGRLSGELDMRTFESSIAPVLHCPTLPIPPLPLETAGKSKESPPSSQGSGTASSGSAPSSQGSPFVPGPSAAPEPSPHFPDQEEMDDLIRDLGLTKEHGELLISRMKGCHIVDSSVKVTSQRIRDLKYLPYFSFENDVCYCSDIRGLFAEIGIECNPEEWRLFIDSSCKSLKAVLLHNGNIFPSLPVAHSMELKEDYQSVKLMLEYIHYEEYKWEVIGDFKMVSFLMGLQGGYTKHPCYLCLWDSRADSLHYVQRDWPERTEFTIGVKNVKWEPLIPPEKILMPPLHIKLGLMKQFVKALKPDSKALTHLKSIFPKISEAKITSGIFVGPDIRLLMTDKSFPRLLTAKEKRAWNSFVSVTTGFLGNEKADDYEKRVRDLVANFRTMGCRMSLKLHVLDAHLDRFKEKMGDFSEEQGERFHQDVKNFENRYRSQRCSARMMSDYVWSLVRETDVRQYRRQTRSKKTVRFGQEEMDTD